MLKHYASVALLLGLASPPSFAAVPGQSTESAITSQIRSDVAEDIAGINAHNPAEATAHEADDTVFSECGRYVSFGRASYQQGLSMAFEHNPEWHLGLIDEAVVVAKSENQAVYRSTYNEDSMRDGVPYTHQGDYVAGFRRDRDGVWRIHWSTVCWRSPSHKK
jgi:ketosteroid isomerase-like protein